MLKFFNLATIVQVQNYFQNLLGALEFSEQTQTTYNKSFCSVITASCEGEVFFLQTKMFFLYKNLFC